MTVLPFIFFTRLIIVNIYGVDILFQDEWDYFVDHILIEHFNSNLTVYDFLRPHNEHHVLFTKLLAYFLFIIDNNQIAAYSTLLVQSILPAAVALPFIFWVRQYGLHRVNYLIIALSFGLPIAVENLFWSVGSQWHFANIAAVSVIYFAAKPDRHAGSIFFVIFFLSVGYLTMVSTLLAGFVAALIFAARYLKNRDIRLIYYSLLSLTGFLILFLIAPAVSENTKPGNFSQFILSLLKSLGTPYYLGLIFIWPAFLFFFLRKFKYRENLNSVELFPLGIMLYIAAQALAVAYGRGAGGEGPGNRHLDMFVLAYPAIALLVSATDISKKFKKIYLVSISLLVLADSLAHLHMLSKTENSRRAMKSNICSAIKNKNLKELSRPGVAVPYFHIPTLQKWLSNKDIAASIECSEQ